jgi:hypothetical protein
MHADVQDEPGDQVAALLEPPTLLRRRGCGLTSTADERTSTSAHLHRS